MALAPAAARGPESGSARLPEGLSAGTPGTAASITDGDTLELADGRIVRLVGIQAPKLPLGRPNFPTWPLAPEAGAALAALAQGRRLTPWFGGARGDRHGRVLAHLVREDGLWLQGEMLARGMARVYTFEDNRAVAAAMYALERQARAGRLGIWAHPFYRVLADGEADRHIGTFQLVEGRVLEAALVRGQGYLNFGADWRTDFTVAVPKRALATFRAAFGRKLEGLQGKRIRVRGWLRRFNGPMIEATHPEQIEVLDR
jgi:endonuclease YncB( thermonuclease family)